MSDTQPEAKPLTPTQWLICTIAVIGFAFDIYELLMLPLIIGPALSEIAGMARGTPEFSQWVGKLFFIPAFAAGIFGLLGGWLTDKFGRRRVLTYSILLYAFSAFAAGFSTNPWMLLFFRCTTFIGVSVEFVAAIAWLAELFPNPKQREKVLGYTQAFSSVGGLMVAVANGLVIKYAADFPSLALPDFLSVFVGEIADGNAPWRYTLISGLLPAIPLIIIRPFLPESPVWKQKKAAETLRRPSILELFATPQLRKVTWLSAVMVGLSYGAAFGAIQHVPRMIPGLPQVVSAPAKSEEDGQRLTAAAQDEGFGDRLRDFWVHWSRSAEIEDPKLRAQLVVSHVTKFQEVGGLAGRILLALLVVWIVSRRNLLRVFLLPGLVVMPLVFVYAAVHDLTLLYFGMFIVGLLTIGQFSFWGNYLPRVFPTHLRGTGSGFAANIGGRMLGTSFAWITTNIVAATSGSEIPDTTRLAYTAAGIAVFVYLANFILSFFLPEPKGKDLPD